MRDGDIYRWLWKDEAKRNDFGGFGAYHCYSQIAVAKAGRLFDTYWSDHSKSLDPDQIELTLLGNSNEMTEIRQYDICYYDRADIVDTRHSNNSRGS